MKAFTSSQSTKVRIGGVVLCVTGAAGIVTAIVQRYPLNGLGDSVAMLSAACAISFGIMLLLDERNNQ